MVRCSEFEETGISTAAETREIEFVDRLRGRDTTAFMELYDRFNRQVFRFSIHMTGSFNEAEELTQSVFASVLEGIANGKFVHFSARKGTLEGYLLGMARNLARAQFKRSRRAVSIDSPGFDRQCDALSENGRTIAAVEQSLELERLQAAILKLPLRFREALILCCLEDVTYQCAAIVLNCSVGTVGSRVNRAKRQIAKILSQPRLSTRRTPVQEEK